MKNSGLKAIIQRSVLQIVRRPIYWAGFFVLPLFCFFLLAGLMENGLPIKVPAAIVDRDGTALSREISQNLAGMQMVEYAESCESFTEARHLLQEGKIYGFFMIPEDFQAELLSGNGPAITFYTNMTYFVPASLLFKTFKTTALFTKAGVALSVLDAVGAESAIASPTALLQPVNITARGLGNPGLNYAIYLCNSFIPCCLQLMIMLMTCFSLGQEVKYHTSPQLMQMAGGSIVKALFGKLLPQTVIWIVMVGFMTSWLYGWNSYPMNGSLWWFGLSQVMFVLAAQSFAVFLYGVLPNLRLSLSICALLGILSFSIAAFSFPVESMYGAVSIFSWIMPIRYNFLIYIDQALNGIPVYYSRIWFVAYLVYFILPFTVLWHIKKAFVKPVYAP